MVCVRHPSQKPGRVAYALLSGDVTFLAKETNTIGSDVARNLSTSFLLWEGRGAGGGGGGTGVYKGAKDLDNMWRTAMIRKYSGGDSHESWVIYGDIMGRGWVGIGASIQGVRTNQTAGENVSLRHAVVLQ